MARVFQVNAKTGRIKKVSNVNYFEWQIQDYFSMSHKVDSTYESPDFEFQDAVWFLQIHPNGHRESNSVGWLSLYLVKRKSDRLRHTVDAILSIKDKNGEDYKRLTFEMTEFLGNAADGGWPEFVELSTLWKDRSKVAPNGTMTISCNWKTGSAKSSQKTSTSKITEDFKNLFLDEYGCDVFLKVKSRVFRAHRCILGARSPVFDTMFKHDMQEKSTGFVNIPDCDPDAFQCFLLYLYSGKAEKLNECNLLNLYFVADKYRVDDLKTECVQFMVKELSVDTFGDLIALATRHEELSLNKTATAFFIKHVKEIIVTKRWQSFMKENPIIANELYMKSLKTCCRCKVRQKLFNPFFWRFRQLLLVIPHATPYLPYY